MKRQKMNLANIQGRMSRGEMKKIMAGSDGGGTVCCTGGISCCGPSSSCTVDEGKNCLNCNNQPPCCC